MANRKTTKYIVIHTTASAGNLTEKSLRAMHRKRGFSDIGYNVWIDRNGKRQKGRGWDRIGAHVGGFNSIAFGVAWDGGAKGNDMTKAQDEELLRVCQEAVKRYPGAKICGHRDLSPDGDRGGVVEPHEWTKTCPWFDAEVWAKKRGLPHTNFSGKASPDGRLSKEPVPEAPDARVMWLQKLLRMQGAQIVADGWMGPKTKAAIEQFERDNGLAITGTFETRATVDLLKKLAKSDTDELQPPTPAPVQPRRPAVTEVAKDAAAEDRVSTTGLAAGGTAVVTGIQTVSKVTEAVDTATSLKEATIVAGPWVLLGLLGAAFAWYIWRERQRKRKAAREALT